MARQIDFYFVDQEGDKIYLADDQDVMKMQELVRAEGKLAGKVIIERVSGIQGNDVLKTSLGSMTGPVVTGDSIN